MRKQDHPRIRRGFLFFATLLAMTVLVEIVPVTATRGADFPPLGFQVSLFEGTSTSAAEPMRTFEGQKFPVEWQAVGYLRFAGNGAGGIAKAASGPPDQTDLAAIRVSLVARWNDPAGNRHEKIMASSGFNDPSMVRNFSPMGGESYSFILETGSLAGENSNLFSIQCDDQALSWFEVCLRSRFPWSGSGNPGIREWGHRPVLVIDTVAPSVVFTIPPENSFPITGTSGDPPPFSTIMVEVSDTNPNQAMASVILAIGEGEGLEMTPGTPRRDHSPVPANLTGRFFLDCSWTPDSAAATLPTGTDEAQITVTAQPKFPVIDAENGAASGIIEILDNDAPCIECVLTWPGPSGQENLTVRVQGGETDIPCDGNGTLDITLGSRGIQTPDPHSRGIHDPAPAPSPVDLGSIFNEVDWPAIPEDTRVTARVRGWDNFDAVPGPGLNLVELKVNGSTAVDGPIPLIFREAGKVASAIEIFARDRAGNTRIVRVPARILDTRMRVNTIK